MRNASKNTIKRVMRKAEYDNSIGFRFHIPKDDQYYSRYNLYNDVGAQIYRMSKGKICNLGLFGINKYRKPLDIKQIINYGYSIHSKA